MADKIKIELVVERVHAGEVAQALDNCARAHANAAEKNRRAVKRGKLRASECAMANASLVAIVHACDRSALLIRDAMKLADRRGVDCGPGVESIGGELFKSDERRKG